jgi:hypothetical protein
MAEGRPLVAEGRGALLIMPIAEAIIHRTYMYHDQSDKSV